MQPEPPHLRAPTDCQLLSAAAPCAPGSLREPAQASLARPRGCSGPGHRRRAAPPAGRTAGWREVGAPLAPSALHRPPRGAGKAAEPGPGGSASFLPLVLGSPWQEGGWFPAPRPAPQWLEPALPALASLHRQETGSTCRGRPRRLGICKQGERRGRKGL